MAGNSIGKLFSVTTCGESHGSGLMAIVDGVPPRMQLKIPSVLWLPLPGRSVRHVLSR